MKTPINNGVLQSNLDGAGFSIVNADVGAGRKFDVKTYGAIGDGLTDDTTAIQDALAEIPSDGGVLYFPAGTYKYTGTTIALDKRITVEGDGGGVHFVDLGPTQSVTGQPSVSTIDFTSSTGTLFTVTAGGCSFKNIGLRNTSVTPPISGAGILIASDGDRTRYENISVSGFYIDIDVQAGSAQVWEGCWLVAPVLYGLKLRNVAVPDGGDHFISNCYFACGPDYAGTAAIRIESGGGTKIVNCKIVAFHASTVWTNGIDLAVTAGITTVDLLICNCSIEGFTDAGIKGRAGASGFWINHVITGNQFYAENDCIGIDFDGSGGTLGNIQINGNVGYVGSSVNAFIKLANITNVSIVGNTAPNYSALLSVGAGVTFARSATIPVGGTTGQSLKKVSNSDYDVGWA